MASTSKEPTRNWVDLPPDLTANILHRLGAIDVLENAQKVCTYWYKVCKDPAMWQVIDIMLNPDHISATFSLLDLEKVRINAVDRSQGQLLDINIDFHSITDRLLRCIADRSSRVKRLKLVNLRSDFGLRNAVRKLPLLEELHLYNNWITAKTVESIGRSCPLLKSFKLVNDRGSIRGLDEATITAIAENMPGLRHLSLFGNVSNAGLQALLDKCPHLESLDLRQCKIDLKGDLLKRCLGQIKDLRCPPCDSGNHKRKSILHGIRLAICTTRIESNNKGKEQDNSIYDSLS